MRNKVGYVREVFGHIVEVEFEGRRFDIGTRLGCLIPSDSWYSKAGGGGQNGSSLLASASDMSLDEVLDALYDIHSQKVTGVDAAPYLERYRELTASPLRPDGKQFPEFMK